MEDRLEEQECSFSFPALLKGSTTTTQMPANSSRTTPLVKKVRFDETWPDVNPKLGEGENSREHDYKDLISCNLGSSTWEIINLGAEILNKVIVERFIKDERRSTHLTV